MKKIFLSVAMLTAVFTFAQKKEIAAAVKAIDAGDIAATTAQLAQAESAMGNKTYLLEPALLEQYYYAKGLSLLKSGKSAEGASYLAKINDLAKNKIYVGKDSSKNKVYYVGKTAADASGIQGLKEETYVPTLMGKLGTSINPVIEAANKAALAAYNEKKYSVAAPKFREVYELLSAAGQDNKKYLYYAGLNYSLGDMKKEATDVYMDLINSNYTGVETTYTAKNKKSSEVVNLEKSTWEVYKKVGAAGDYTDFKTETSNSIEREMYEDIVRNLFELSRYDEAIALADKGLKKYPNNESLTNVKGLSYYKSGKSNEFIEVLKQQISINPKDYDSWFNLGFMQKNDPKLLNEAQASFEKAIELKPDYVAAYQNLTFLVMGDETKATEDYNTARKAGKMELANQLIDARRIRFAKALPFAEKWHKYDPNNLDAVTLLKGLYMSTKNEAKYQEFKAKENAMKSEPQ